jgi:hypothetical protein
VVPSHCGKRTGCTTMAPSGKERALSPTPTETGTVATVSKEEMLQLKKGIPKVSPPVHFYGDRTKFQAYVLQVRTYLWADNLRPLKPIDMRELSSYRDRVIWAASYLRGEAEARFRPYVEDKLMNGVKCRTEITEIFAHTDNYFAFLSMSYGDLNEARTAELEINRLRQKDSFLKYLARFTGYASQIA